MGVPPCRAGCPPRVHIVPAAGDAESTILDGGRRVAAAEPGAVADNRRVGQIQFSQAAEQVAWPFCCAGAEDRCGRSTIR